MTRLLAHQANKLALDTTTVVFFSKTKLLSELCFHLGSQTVTTTKVITELKAWSRTYPNISSYLAKSWPGELKYTPTAADRADMLRVQKKWKAEDRVNGLTPGAGAHAGEIELAFACAADRRVDMAVIDDGRGRALTGQLAGIEVKSSSGLAVEMTALKELTHADGLSVYQAAIRGGDPDEFTRLVEDHPAYAQ